MATISGVEIARAAFYRPDYVVLANADRDRQVQRRADFIRGADGRIEWLRLDGRLLRHE